MTFKAGVVGCGRIGSELDDDPKRKQIVTHAGAYCAVDEVDLVAACDLSKEKLEKCGKRWQITSLYQDLGEMLKNEALDVISICTWNSTHLEIVKEAINNGVRAIFCEKPIADSLRNADEMVKLCDEKGVILQIDHQRRFDKFHQEVRRFIQDGNLGRIQQVTFYYTAGIANSGSHLFDLLRFFFGDVEWVRAFYSQNKSANPDDPNIDGIMQFGNGTFCAIQSCDVREFLIFEMACIGTRGRLNITHSGFDLEFYEVGESKLFSGYRELFASTPPIHKDIPREFMVSAVRHLVECLKEGKKPICSGEDGRASLELIYAFHESAKAEGERISLPLADSEVEIKSR
jgi:predicted dehydrogenase